MSVKIYVRDNTNGKVHEYGTNQHDALILQDDGSLHYQNLQNGCGTMYPDEGYTFCEADGSDPRTSGDYIHYGVEPYIDIGGKEEDHTCVPCKWISVQERLPEISEGCAESPEPVLYMMKNTKTIYAGYYGEGGVWKDKYFRQYADSRNGVDADDVLCWMYQHDLTHPPKGE